MRVSGGWGKMVFIVKKKINGQEYYYLRASSRVIVNGRSKVKAITLGYFGKDKKKAQEKLFEMNWIGNNKLNKPRFVEQDMSKKIVKITYFVHGTTLDNERDVSSGWFDVELSKVGIKQSEELPKLIGNKKFDAVFSSDLKRAVKSAEISFGKNYNLIQDSRLRECNYGDYNTKLSKVVEPMQEKCVHKKFPNGESYEDVKKRILSFLYFLLENYSGKHIAIIAHKAPQLVLDVLLKNKTWEQAFQGDWRKTRSWQPGWDYEVSETLINSFNKQKDMVENKEKSEKNEKSKISVDELANFCKSEGFVYRSSDIYGGFSGFWDFGPLGIELFKNIKEDWWNYFVHQKENMTGIEASIISHPKTWIASGHVANFSDVAVICKKCKTATKIDKSEVGKVKCDCGGEYDVKGEFSLMFKTKVGAIDTTDAYLRGETAQGMFLDFKLVQQTTRKQLPFGIAQIGRCFRNEIAPRDFLFRSREFNIAEFEFFINPEEKKCDLLEDKHLKLKLRLLDTETQQAGKTDLKETTIGEMLSENKLEEWHAYWLAEQILWYQSIGLEEIKIREHTKEELSHYSSATFDIDYEFPFGSKELGGIANRGQYDLTQHAKASSQKMEVRDEKYKNNVVAKVIEPTFGMERAFLAVITKAYNFDEKRKNIVLKLAPKLAPVKASVFPIIKEEQYEKIAKEIADVLRKEWNIAYDNSGSIGRRYSRNDEIGTPMCITIDEETPKDKAVTIRDRDTTKQIRVKILELREVVRKVIDGENLLALGKLVETRVKE